MAKMMRKATVHRFCAAVPAYHISTRLVGMTTEASVMSAPLYAIRRRTYVQTER
jgi:hypothetical protein